MVEQYLLKKHRTGRSTKLLIALLLFGYGLGCIVAFVLDIGAAFELQQKNAAQKIDILAQAKVWSGIPDSILWIRHTEGIDTERFIPPAELFILAGDSVFYFPDIHVQNGVPNDLYTIHFNPKDSSGLYRILQMSSADEDYIDLEDAVDFKYPGIAPLFLILIISPLPFWFGGRKLLRLIREFWNRARILRGIRKQKIETQPDDEHTREQLEKSYKEFVDSNQTAFNIGVFVILVFSFMPFKYLSYLTPREDSDIPDGTIFELSGHYIIWAIILFIFAYFYTAYRVRKYSYRRDLQAKQLVELRGTIAELSDMKENDKYYWISIKAGDIRFNSLAVPKSRFSTCVEEDPMVAIFYPHTLVMVDCYQGYERNKG